ncbi:DMT family transporter [Pseudomonas putida]|uniref:DMT family transporter n=1 Tax=Pseudomonas putida TaxID=303 RepID=UPI0021F8FF9B|nr:DMT family transporter [Pseudomonas putida]
MDVIMGLVAALCWGVTDYLVGVNARTFGVKYSVFFSQLIGFLMLSGFVFISSSGFSFIIRLPVDVVLICASAAILTLLGAVSLTRAFEHGRIAIVAPLVTSYGIFTTLLAWMSGEILTSYQILGLGVCAFGVMLVGLGHKSHGFVSNRKEGGAICFALIAAILYGSSFWVQGNYALPAVGAVNMLWMSYLVGALLLMPLVFSVKTKKRIGLSSYGALGGASLFNLGGFTAFSYGALSGSVAVVTVISTLSGGVAAVLGYIFYRDRLTLLQWLGIGLVLAGAVVLHLV